MTVRIECVVKRNDFTYANEKTYLVVQSDKDGYDGVTIKIILMDEGSGVLGETIIKADDLALAVAKCATTAKKKKNLDNQVPIAGIKV